MHYVTRERVHVDRISSAWAIRRFVDSEATFEFVPNTKDARTVDGIPFDMRGAQLGHHNGGCTFDAVLEQYELGDPALARMAAIIRGADLPADDTTPAESPGVRAVFDGVRSNGATDDERLKLGAVVCEALYAYCSSPPATG